MKRILLRETTPEDAPALAALLERLPEWFTAEEVETVRAVAADLPGLAAINENDAVIGFLVWEQRLDEWEICWIAVAKELHRRGTGQMLLARMLEQVRESGVKRVRVKTVAPTVEYEPYARTRAFYEACGFRLESIQPHGWPDGTDKAEYVLDLPV